MKKAAILLAVIFPFIYGCQSTVDSNFKQAESYSFSGNNNLAIEFYTKCIQEDKTYWKAYAKRALMYSYSKQCEKALEDCNTVFKLRPDFVIGYYGLMGDVHSNCGEYDKAILYFNKAIMMNPDGKNMSFLSRANAYVHTGEFDKAILDCTRFINSCPSISLTFIYRAKAYIGVGEYDKAISDCNKAIESSSNYYDSYETRAIAFYHKKEYDLAWKDVLRVEELGKKCDMDFLSKLSAASKRP